jgi:Pex2 / Pex12 amino terminal region
MSHENNSDGNGGSINPMSTSTSVAALLAEEWTVQPFAVLPSFLELAMIRDAETALSSQWTRMQQQPALLFLRDNTAVVALLFSHRWTTRTAAAVDGFLERRGSEIGALLRYWAERYCLHAPRGNSTLAEALYGMRREKVVVAAAAPATTKGNDSDGTVQTATTHTQQWRPLQRHDRTRLALYIALSPYLKEKVQMLYSLWRQQQQQRSNILKTVLVQCYPIASDALQLADVFRQWRYLLRLSPCGDLRDTVLRQVVRRGTLQQDVTPSAPGGAAPPDHRDGKTTAVKGVVVPESDGSASPSTKEVSSSASSSATTVPHSTGTHTFANPKSLIQSAILYATASCLVLNWVTQMRAWYQERYRQQILQNTSADDNVEEDDFSSHHRRAAVVHSSILPPPPCGITETAAAAAQTSPPPQGCPLCGRVGECILPTACAATGWVFCARCIRTYLHDHDGRCPVTGRPLLESQLVRLYEPTATTATSSADTSVL